MRPTLRLAHCVLLALALALPCSAWAGKARHYAGREDVRAFIAQMVDKHGFEGAELRALFRHAQYQPTVITAITPPRTSRAKSWQAYRDNFVNPARIEAGVAFLEREHAALALAAKRYGIPEEIIAAIIGVETAYGRNTGGYRVIDALATLAFDYPPRAAFFRAELENFLLYARDTGIDTLGIKGSYAGAIGIPQFMPGSYRRYAVDFDGEGTPDLSGSFADAIGSVANFLKEHGWRSGEPVAFAAKVQGEAYRALVDGGVKPRLRYAELAQSGVSTEGVANPDELCALIELTTPDAASEYLVGLHNFYVITRYNRSSMYATAVLQLAQAIKAMAP